MKLSRLCQASGVACVLAAVSVVAAACGSSPSVGVASLGPTRTDTTIPAASGNSDPFVNSQTLYSDALLYAQCMRTHGEPRFPDPQLMNTAHAHGIQIGGNVNQSTPQYKSANKACEHFLPDNGGPPSAKQTAALTATLLEFAKCMRTHGIPDFPDPKLQTNGNGVQILMDGPGMGASAPQFQHAQKACNSLMPGGGP